MEKMKASAGQETCAEQKKRPVLNKTKELAADEPR
jgi:hypothetical protein